MKSSIIFCSMVLALLLSLNAAFAQAPTITFTVPVQFTNIHQNITQFRIRGFCYAADGTTVVGEGVTVLDMPADGNLNQDVTVTVHQRDGQDITRAVTYICHFDLWTPEIGNWAHSSQAGTGMITIQPKENTTYVNQVTGPVNW